MRIIKYQMKINEKEQITLVKEEAHNFPLEYDIRNPAGAAQVLNQLYGLKDMAEEYFYVLALGRRKILGVFELSHGGVSMTSASSRTMFMAALLAGASCIIAAHNHPSGSLYPSEDDIRVTKKIREAGQMLEIPLLDHIIVGHGTDRFYSMRENGYME